MTIYIDPSELRENSTLPNNITATEAPGLEEYTGADIMLSTFAMPVASKPFIKMHIENGAILVQRKHGLDLLSSIGDRMTHSLARMRATGAKQSQCLLMFVGYVRCDDQGRAIINEQETGAQFFTIQGAISKWHDRGGVYESVPKPSLLRKWCEMKLKHLKEYKENPIKYSFPQPPKIDDWDNPLQIPERVVDGRILLAMLPGIGVKKANALWKYYEGYSEPTFAGIITALTDMNIGQMKGIGDKTQMNVREFIGLAKGLNLEIVSEVPKLK